MVRQAATLLTALCCSGCIALLHDSYFSPGSSEPHELRSPVRGHPAELWTVFGSPPDIITIERDGIRIGLHARASRVGTSSLLLPEGEPVESFDLEIAGLRTEAGLLVPALLHFSLVEGWRAAALP